MGILDNFFENRRTSQALLEQISELTKDNSLLAESYSAMAHATAAFDEAGWKPLYQAQQTGVQLNQVQEVSESARKQTTSNSLLKRGAALRAGYVFGRGFKMASDGGELAARHKAMIKNPINRKVLFSKDACKKNEKALFTDGNFFVRFNKSTNVFSRIPLAEISGFARDPDDPETIRYYKREYLRGELDSKSEGGVRYTTVEVWYPLDYVKNPVDKIQDIPVDRNFVVIDIKANDDTGGLWGVPDALPAMPWAWAYSEYLKDGSKVLKALASIAWQVRTKSDRGAKNISQKLTKNRDVAATAVTGSNVELSAMPRNNSVDLSTGMPLAAMTATSLEISVNALLAGSGETGGAASQIIDQPTLSAAYTRQGSWEEFFLRVLNVMKVPEPSVTFNNIIVDPAYRTVQSLATAWMSGLFDAEIMQEAFAEQIGIEAPGKVPDGVLIPNNVQSNPSDGATLGSGNPNNTATSQGNSGAGNGDLSDGDNNLRDLDNNPR